MISGVSRFTTATVAAILLATAILPGAAFAADGDLTGFEVEFASAPRAGSPVLVTVTAKAGPDTKTNFEGLVLLQTSDPKVAPQTYQYRAQDEGVHPFVVIFHTADAHTVSITPLPTGPQGQSEETLVAAGPLDHVHILDASGQEMLLPTATSSGATFQLVAQGRDADDNNLGPITVDWTVNGDIGRVSPTRGDSTTFTATKMGVGTVTAAAGAVTRESGQIVVLPGLAVARIAIEAVPGGRNMPVDGQPISTDERKALFAVGYDAEGNYAGEASVDWTVTPASAPCGEVLSASGSSTLFDPKRAGASGCRVHAASTSLGLQADTPALHLVPGAPVALGIRAGSLTGPLMEGDAAMLATSQVVTLHAALQDADGNVVGPAPTDTAWTVLHGCGVLNATTGASVRFEATTPAQPEARCRVRAAAADADAPYEPDQEDAQSFGKAMAFTGALHVVGGPVASLTIRTSPGGAGVAVTSLALTADDAPVPLYAAGYDVAGHFVGDQAGATWTSTDPAKATIAPEGDHAALTALHPPGVTLTVAVGARQAQASISIAPGVPATLVVHNEAGQPVSAITLAGGDNAILSATTTDARGNDAGPVAASWSVEGACGSISDPQGAATTFVAGYIAHSPCSIRASSGALADATVTITVNPPALAAITLRDAPDGAGEPVTDIVQASGSTRTVYAAGYDAAGHFLGDQAATWDISPSSLGAVDVDGATATFEAQIVGSGALEATLGSIVGSASVTVAHGPLDQISIEDAPGGAGEPLDAAQMRVDEQRIFYAVGRDAAGNFVVDAPVAWTLDGAVGTITPPQGAATTLTALRVGAATLVATDTAGRSGRTEIAVSGIVNHIAVRTAGDDTGVNDPGRVMLPGDTVTLYAVGLDANGLYAGPVVVDWRVGMGLAGLPLGSLSSTRGISTVLTAQKAGSGVVFAKDDSDNAASSGTIQVQPGTFHHFTFSTLPIDSPLVCEPAELGLPTTTEAGAVLMLSVAACDDHDNLQPAYAGQVAFSSTDEDAVLPGAVTYAPMDGGVKSGSFSLRTSGAQSVTATDTATQGSGTMQTSVLPSALSAFAFEGVPASATAGQGFTATIRARDAFGNDVLSYTGPTSLATTSGAVSPAMVAFTDGQGTVTVTPTTSGTSKVLTATDGSVTSTQTFAVVPGSRASVRIVDGVSSVVAVVDKTFMAGDAAAQMWAADFDAYDNRIGAATVTWSVVGGIGTLSAASGSSASFTPTTSGTGHLHVVDAGGLGDDTGTFTVTPGGLHHMTLTPTTSTPTAGVAFDAVVKLYDSNGNVKTDATHRVVLTSSDTSATLPLSHAFVAGDAGEFTFTGIVLRTSGSRTLTATATPTATNGAIQATLTVQTASAATVSLSCASSCTFTAGVASSIVVKGVDAFGNTATSYSPAALTPSGLTASPSGDSGACATSAPAFANGQATISCTLYDARQATSLSITDGTLTSAPLAITVVPGPAVSFALALDGQAFQAATGTAAGTPNVHTAGQARPLALRALDVYRNVVTTYAGDHHVVFDGPIAFDNVTLPTATSKLGVAVPFGADTTLEFTGGLAATALTLYRAGPSQLIGAQEHVKTSQSPPAVPRSVSGAVTVGPGSTAVQLGILRCAPPSDPTAASARDCILASGSVNGLTPGGYGVVAGATTRFYVGTLDAWDNVMTADAAPWVVDASTPAYRSVGTASLDSTAKLGTAQRSGSLRYFDAEWSAGDDVLSVTHTGLRPAALHIHVA